MSPGEPDDDDSEYSLQPEAEPAVPALPRAKPRVLPQPVITGRRAPLASRATTPKNATVELAKIVIGGMVGLMLGFLLLAVVFQFDFNPVLPEQEKPKAAAEGLPVPPPPPRTGNVSEKSAARPPAAP